MPRITLVTGGARSGKSGYSLALAERHARPAFIATGEPFDDEMRERIERHREERGERFVTLEEPLDPAAAIGRLPADTGVVVVDCLTTWLGNLIHHNGGEELTESARFPEIDAFLAALDRPPFPVVVVTNEVGLGLVSPTPLGRVFTDLAGRLNQQVAARAERVVLLVCGLPLVLKGAPE